MFEAKELRSNAQQIAEQIRISIVRGTLRVGDKLPQETELAASFGVNRATIREALYMLSFFGMIETRHGARGGHFVRMVSPQDLGRIFSLSVSLLRDFRSLTVNEISEVRELLEVPSCRWAAERRTEAELDEIAQDAEAEITVEKDARFHRAIARASHNRLQEMQIHAIYTCLQPYLEKLIQIDPKIQVMGKKHHYLIYEAIRDKDADRAEALMREHMKYLVNRREYEKMELNS